MMRKNIWNRGLAAVAAIGLMIGNTGCSPRISSGERGTPEEGQRVLTYLGREITLPVRVEKIAVTGALEALEDLLALGVKPAGMMTIGGKFPAMFAGISENAQGIGERMQPSLEAILKLGPDVILSSDKFPATAAAKLDKIAPNIRISHYPEDGVANLLFLGELTGTRDQALAVLEQYSQDLALAKKRLPETAKARKVVAIRLRAGNICVYPTGLFFNDLLYNELGLSAPEALREVKTQEIMALEKFSEMNPDDIFLQYEVSESPGHPNILEELQQNPVWQGMKAVQTGRVFVNVVDPLIQGVAIGGKIQFLKAVMERLPSN